MGTVERARLDERQRILNDAYCGRITPDQAEEQAKRLSLAPFANSPPAHSFDPLKALSWSLSMSIAWVAWRNSEKVKAAWSEFCRESWEWRAHPKGWEVITRQTSTVSLMGISESDADSEDNVGKLVSVKTAKEQIWSRLANGDISATGFSRSSGFESPVVIPAHEWMSLVLVENAGGIEEVRQETKILQAEYQNIKFRSADLVKLWPDSSKCSSQNKRGGRPSKLGPVLEAYNRHFPNGHDGTTWKVITNRVSDDLGFKVSQSSILRVLGLKK